MKNDMLNICVFSELFYFYFLVQFRRFLNARGKKKANTAHEWQCRKQRYQTFGSVLRSWEMDREPGILGSEISIAGIIIVSFAHNSANMDDKIWGIIYSLP